MWSGSGDWCHTGRVRRRLAATGRAPARHGALLMVAASGPDVTYDALDSTSRPDVDTRMAVLPHLATAATACAEGRRFVAEHLRRWALPFQVSDTVVLLTSELIANAVRHGPPPLCLQLDVDQRRARVEVSDSNPVIPVLTRPNFEAVGGRGLWLVDTLAKAWGCTPQPPGKVVWFEVTLMSAQG